ncbi:MAG: hypothetical protein Q8Q04_01450 [archaeon]|nr:hypothetical protein [archaeon]
MSGKKGLSTVVTTLIIVLLVLAAIGIIWGPIRSLLTSSTNSLGGTACLELDLTATRVNETAAGVYDVTLRRGGAGSNTQNVGAKLILYSDSAVSDTFSFGETLTPLQVKTASVDTTVGATVTGLLGANKVEVVPYFIDSDTGEERVCTTSTSFSF